MAKAEIDEGRGVIEITATFRERELVRQVPGAKWSKHGDKWTAPLSWPVCIAMRGVFGENLELGDRLLDWAWDASANNAEAINLRDMAMDGGHEDGSIYLFNGNLLRPYQAAGVDYLNHVQNAILADEMGLGKTVEAVVAVEADEAYPCLVVCPKAVKSSWKETFETWTPARKVVVVESSKKARQFREAELADVVIVNWDMLATNSRVSGYGSIRLTDKEKELGPLNRAWSTVIADEAHKAKDPKSKRTRALWAIRQTAGRALALTGTPVANDPRDFWSLLHFVEPEEWPGRSQFMDRYCLLSQNYWGGVDVLGLNPANRDEFHSVTGRRFLRRIKQSVLRDLPDKQYVVRSCPMSPQQQRAYHQMVENQVAWIDDEAVAAFDPLAVTTRLLQFSSAMARVDEDSGRVILASPSNKVEGLLELVEEVGEEPLVVFAVSRQLVDLCEAGLTKAGVTNARITGAENEAQREAAKRRFRGGDAQVILLTVGAGGTGLDGLQERSSTVVFLQRSYSYIENMQAEDRLHRIGQSNAVTVVDLITPDTLEETAVLPALRRKKDVADEVTRDRQAMRRLLAP